MNTENIEKIIEIFEKSNVGSLELEIDGMKIRLSKGTTLESSNTKTQVENTVLNTSSEKKDEISSTDEYITSPLVGTYHEKPAPSASVFVNKGDKVKKGQKLCIIEAMKVMNEVYASKDGIIKDILCKENQMVEFGQKLFVIGEENV